MIVIVLDYLMAFPKSQQLLASDENKLVLSEVLLFESSWGRDVNELFIVSDSLKTIRNNKNNGICLKTIKQISIQN